jgi:predicted transcriptional regulator
VSGAVAGEGGRYWPTDEAYDALGLPRMHVHIDGLNVTDRVLLITGPELDTELVAETMQAIAQELKAAGALTVLVADSHVSITTLDEDAMARAGWVRADR